MMFLRSFPPHRVYWGGSAWPASWREASWGARIAALGVMAMFGMFAVMAAFVVMALVWSVFQH